MCPASARALSVPALFLLVPLLVPAQSGHPITSGRGSLCIDLQIICGFTVTPHNHHHYPSFFLCSHSVILQKWWMSCGECKLPAKFHILKLQVTYILPVTFLLYTIYIPYHTYSTSCIICWHYSIFLIVAFPNASVKTVVVILSLSFSRVEAYKAVVNY